MVDYVDEMENPKTIREYEWRGIVRTVDESDGGRRR